MRHSVRSGALLLLLASACGNDSVSGGQVYSGMGSALDASVTSADAEIYADLQHTGTGATAEPGDASNTGDDRSDQYDASNASGDTSNPSGDASNASGDTSNPSGDASIASGDASIASGDASGRGLQTLFVDGLAVYVYLPVSVQATEAVPVVFSLHGLSIPAFMMADITGLMPVADREGFVAVFPEGSGGSWNTGGAMCGLGSFTTSAADDVAYLQHVLDAVEELQALDRAHVFVSGFSMGGYGTNNLTCKRPDLFRAGAAASGGRTIQPCDPAPAPIMILHGTSDGTIAYDCGVQARTAWVQHNGCSSEVDTVPMKGGHCEWSRGCPDNGQVVLCSFDGMGHGWAGSLNPFALGGTQFESATELMWDFFKDYL